MAPGVPFLLWGTQLRSLSVDINKYAPDFQLIVGTSEAYLEELPYTLANILAVTNLWSPSSRQQDRDSLQTPNWQNRQTCRQIPAHIQ
jgi:hypothetical protein